MSSYILSKCSSDFLCNWVRPAQPADLMVLLTSALLMEPCCCNNLTVCASFRLSLLFCTAAFMPGPSNMRAVRSISSYKFAYSNEKVLSGGLKYNGLTVKIHNNYLGALPQL